MLKLNIYKIFLVFVLFLLKKTGKYIMSYIFSTITRILTSLINYVLEKMYNYYVVHVYLSELGVIIFSMYVWYRSAPCYITYKLYSVFISYTYHRNIYSLVRYLEFIYSAAFLITLYHNSLSIYSLFFIFTFSINDVKPLEDNILNEYTFFKGL